ncbi:MAG: hypothetical protein FD166_1693 [Bacteroidetes bacterium]|nr:MAG: hypothetical protein FD166_1693 [Bacteroidota bacterium]
MAIQLMAANILLMAGPLIAQVVTPQTDRVTWYLQTEQIALAKSVMLKSLENKTISADQAFNLGKIYLDIQKNDSALLAFNAIPTMNEEQRLLQLAGQLLVELAHGKSTDISMKIARETKAINSSKSAKVKLQMALVLAQMNETATAWELIEQACALKTSDASTFTEAGDIYARLSFVLKQPELYGKACGRYEQAIYRNKNYLPARSSLAEAYFKSRNYFEAKTILNETMAIDSSWIPAIRLLGEVHYALGNYKQASHYYTRYVNLVKPSVDQLQKYTYILYFNQEYQKAKEILGTLLSSDPLNAVLLRLYAYTSAETKASGEGLRAIEQFMKIRQAEDTLRLIPTDYEYYGRLLSMESYDSLAVIQFEKAIQLDTTKISLFEYTAKSFEKLKNYEKSVSFYTRAVNANPQSPSTLWFSRGRNCLLFAETPEVAADSVRKTKYLNLAVESFSKVAELSPVSHLGFLWKGRALAALDPETSQGLAEECYRQSILLLEAKNATEKYKTELLEAYRYMGYLNYLRYDQSVKDKKTEASGFKDKSIEYWNKILTFDPSNQVALQALKALK